MRRKSITIRVRIKDLEEFDRARRRIAMQHPLQLTPTRSDILRRAIRDWTEKHGK